MRTKSQKPASDYTVEFWRAYFEILNERVPLVDHWRDGSITWHPRVVQKLLWYSNLPDTPVNRTMAHDWLMQNATTPVKQRADARSSPPLDRP
jgi:hypothetical protein